MILFNEFNGFAQQFQWICSAILPLLLITNVAFAVRFRQSRPFRLSLQSLRNYNIVMVVRAYTTSREERWSVFCFNYVFPSVRSCSPPFKGRGRGGVCILFTTKKIQTQPRPPATPPLEGDGSGCASFFHHFHHINTSTFGSSKLFWSLAIWTTGGYADPPLQSISWISGIGTNVQTPKPAPET